MTMGTALGGVGTGGTKALLVRAAGPSLGALGVGGVLPDPTLAINRLGANEPTVFATNDDWGGAAGLSAAFASVGAFPYTAGGSKDAAVFNSAFAVGSYTVQVAGTGGAGIVIAEIYDATPASSFTAATPRLVNVSVLKQIGAGASLTAGFVVGGTGGKQILIRAVGPGLAPELIFVLARVGHRHARTGGNNVPAGDFFLQIGRASCRERVSLNV